MPAISPMSPTSICVAIALSAASVSVDAGLIYSEGFVPNADSPAPLGDTQIQWQVFGEDGTNYSSVGNTVSRAISDTNAPDGDGFRTYMGGGGAIDLVMQSDAPAITTSQRDAELTFSFQHSDNAHSTTNEAGTLRFLAKVGVNWYVSDVIAASLSGYTTESIAVESSNWYAWETNLADGFDATGISSTAVALPAGNIDAVGLLLLDPNGSAAFRIDDFQINGTIPEPGSLGLLGLGLLGCFSRRGG